MGFLNGWLGLALAAVGLPVLIHLLNRRRARRQTFSSLEFLDEVSRRQRRRVQLRQWLLLALRMLIIALTVFAMMRPALRGQGGGSGSASAVVILDDSMSMAAGTEESSHLEVARERLVDMAPLFGGDDRVQLIWPGDPPRVVFDSPVQDFGRVQGLAERTAPGYARARMDAALSAALRDLETHPGLNREIFVVSDFQRDDWDFAADPPVLPDDVRIYLVPVAAADVPNVSVAAASYAPASVRTGAAGAVRVTLANHSDRALGGYPIRVFSGDTPVAEGTLRVPVDELATAELPLLEAPKPGEPLQVRIAEDALALDDLAWVTPGDRQTIRVLIVHGGEPEEMTREPYLRLALDPPGSAGERLFDVQEIPLRDLPVQTELDHDVFILNNVERLSAGVISRLRLAHREGAGLFVILGDRVDLRYYNTHVLEDFIEATLEDPQSAEAGFFNLHLEVPGHPVFEGFRADMGEDLTAARFRRVVPINLNGGGERVLASFGDLPALVEGERLLLFTSAVDLRWGSFPTGGSFLPFIHQAVLSLASRAVESRQFKAGNPIVLDVPLKELPGEVITFGPDGEELPTRQAPSGTMVQIRTDPAPAPEIYRFLSAGETVREVSVQVDAQEGRLRFADPEAVAASLGETVSVLQLGEPLAGRVLEHRRGREIWRELLLVAFLLMLIETAVGRVRLA